MLNTVSRIELNLMLALDAGTSKLLSNNGPGMIFTQELAESNPH
jgi:hypothetical protein